MVPRPRVVIKTEYYYSSGEDSESDDECYQPDEVDTDSESETDSDISDSEDGTDYETESELESDSEELDDPKPYFGEGFRVYFDSHADKRFFMRAFGFLDA